MRLLDDLARRDNVINRLHPLTQLLTLVTFLVAVVSFGRYETTRLLPLVFYPVIIIAAGDVPVSPVLKRVAAVLPIIVGIGIFNPIFDQNVVYFGSSAISAGWLAFISLVIKGIMTVSAAVLLIAASGIDRIAAALRMIKVPKVFVLQLLMTYRYITVLAEEAYRLSTAYSLRAPGQKGIHPASWGSFAGQLLLRAFDRADRVYKAMRLRGFNGDFPTGGTMALRPGDGAWFILWTLFFVFVRIVDVPLFLGSLLGGIF
jgi:cobalt/nickel transport system permease protein